MFRRQLVLRIAVLAVAASAVWNGRLPAQNPAPAATPDANALYTASAIAFERGDYQGAVVSINALLTQIPANLPPADGEKLAVQLEPVYFSLGAAYYNLKDWPKASAAFKDYLTRYPRGARLNEARLSLAQAAFFAKDYAAASAGFAALEENPQLREQALMYEGLAYKEAGDVDRAISTLERLVASGIHSDASARAAMGLVTLYAGKTQTDKALKILTDLRANVAQIEDPLEFNNAAFQQGDAFLAADNAKDALLCYHAVLSRSEVLALLRQRVATLQRRTDANKAAARANPRAGVALLLSNKQILDAIAETQNAMQTLEKAADSRAALLFRIGRAHALLGKPWEALVAYSDLLGFSKDPADREPVLYGVATAYVDAGRLADARTACENYLKEFPNGPHSDAAGYLLGTTALQENNPAAAEQYFGRMLADQPGSTMTSEMRFLLGNAQFAQSKYDDARKEYKRYLDDNPSGPHREEAFYRIALAGVFAAEYDEALKRLDDYLQRYPDGAFTADARYRRALCLFAAQKNEEALAVCRDWLRQYPQDQERGEVNALIGDAQAALGHPDEALAAYQQSCQVAASDDVLGYSIMEAEKLLQKRGDWPAIGAMFKEFVRQHPDHPLVATAMSWIVRADTKAGRVEDAKRFLADNVKRFMGDRQRAGVEGLLDQLANLCVRRKPAPGDADPVVEFNALLGGGETGMNAVAQARMLYARSQLARARRHEDEAQRDLLEIAARYRPADLSALLLGQVGDALLAAGKPEAASFFQEILDAFPKSDVADYGYNGLGAVALGKGDPERALAWFNNGLEKSTAGYKLKDLTLGKAQALLALGRFDEAKKLFEQVAATREWRGEATAASVYSLGEIEARQNRWAEANAYYQRVYVAYQRFLPWVAKAYLGSATSLEKLGRTQDAINTYREMLRNEKLVASPEAEQARERLKSMGAS